MEPPSRSARFGLSWRASTFCGSLAIPIASPEHEAVVVGEPGAQLARRLGPGALRADPGAAHLDIGGAHLAGGPQRLGERPGGDPHAIGSCEPRDHLDPAFQLVGRHGAEGAPHILVEQRAYAGLHEGACLHRKRFEQCQRVLVGGEELAGAPAVGP